MDMHHTPLPALYAPINFVANTGGPNKVYMSEVQHEANSRTSTNDTRTMAIHDARQMARPASLDVEGFSLVEAPSAVTTYLDEDQVTTVYYPEVIKLLKAQTGAREVFIFDHTVRIQDQAKREKSGTRLPVPMAHNDYTEKSAPQRVRDMLSADKAEDVLAQRYAFVNVWRSIGESAERQPLASADARTVAPSDHVKTDLIYPHRSGEIYQTAYNPNQRWYYYPNMTRDEAMLLKVFDSAQDGRARYSAHGAFDNPRVGDDTPARESIEVRAFLSFAPTSL